MQNRSLTNPLWIKAKWILFLFLGLLSSVLLFLEQPTLKAGLLLIVAIWAFCRFYYFAFCVIERYVDSDYRYSGIFSLLRYLFRPPSSPAIECWTAAGKDGAVQLQASSSSPAHGVLWAIVKL